MLRILQNAAAANVRQLVRTSWYSTKNSPLLCLSCGVKLQFEHEDKIGFTHYDENDKGSKKPTTITDYFGLTREEMLSKNFRIYYGNLPEKHEYYKTKGSGRKPVCLRCWEAVHQNVYKKEDHPFVPVEQALKQIPKTAKVVHVVSAQDFPLSVSNKVIGHFGKDNVWVVVNKMDLLFTGTSFLDSYGGKYFGKIIRKMTGVDRDRVICVSSKTGAGINELDKRLPQGTLYFVGETNTGKSSLVRKLAEHQKERKHGSKMVLPQAISWPLFTRSLYRVPLEQRKSHLIDTPGYTAPDGGIYKYAKNEKLQGISTIKRSPSELPRKHQLRSILCRSPRFFSGKTVFSVGGMFFMRPPKGYGLRVNSCLSGKELRFTDLNSGVNALTVHGPEFRENFVVSSAAAGELSRYVIPAFFGAVDIVIRGVGFLSFAPTGKLCENEIFDIWVPKGLEVIIRENIFNYIYKRPQEVPGGDKKVNLYRKVPNDRLIYTRLIPVPEDRSTEQVLKDIDPDGTIRKELASAPVERKFSNPGWIPVELD